MDDPQAKTVMTRNVATVREDLPIKNLIKMVKERRYSGFPVIDDEGSAIGLVSQNDVLRALAYYQVTEEKEPLEGFEEGKRKAAARLLEADPGPNAEPGPVSLHDLLAQPVSSVMTHTLRACAEETPLSRVCAIMAESHIRRVVVLGGKGEVAGIITATDLVQYFAKLMKTRD
jgi:CBS domain-containing protein